MIREVRRTLVANVLLSSFEAIEVADARQAVTRKLKAVIEKCASTAIIEGDAAQRAINT